jgi:hypothetical protein
MRRAAVLGFAVCLLSPRLSFASGEPDAFALTGIGARAGGMGNAAIGLSDQIETIYYNPAGLGNLTQHGATAMYETPTLSTSRGFVGFNVHFPKAILPGSLGFGWLRLNSSDIELTNTNEQILGTDTLTNDLFLLGYGAALSRAITLGAALKYYRFAFDGFHESGIGYDVGIHAHCGVFRAGASFTDFGGTLLKGNSINPTEGTVGDKVPPRLRPGLGVVLPNPFQWPLLFNFDIDGLIKLQGAQDTRLFSGLEVWGFQDHFAVRAGFEQAVGPTIGFGARLGAFQLDYGFLLSENLQDEHRLGTTVRF